MADEPKDPAILAKEEADAKAKAEADAKQAALDAELKAKEEKKANLDKAIAEADEILRKKREEAKNAAPAPKTDEELEIDETDPGVKAWDKRIDSKLTPALQELEKEKAEVRTLALREFLADKPALAQDPNKVKELVELYDKIKVATERNKEGVLLDLNKAFAAIYHEQLIDAARTQKLDRVKELNLFNQPAIDKGATGYVEEPKRMPNMSADDIAQLAKWGMTPQQWWDMQHPKPSA